MARYNQALVEAYRARDQGKLAHVATEAEGNRVGAVIDGLLARGQVMVARQTSYRVEKVVHASEGLYNVETVEAWSYEHRAADAPGVAVPPKTVEYRMSYQVRRIGDAWLVQHAAAGGETVKPVGGAR